MTFFLQKNKITNGSNDRRNTRGFFLVELIVAISIFGIVMSISIGSLVSALDANRKTQALSSVLNNLNVVLDTMTKNIAVGTHYHCEAASEFPPEPQDCNVETGGAGEISFLFNEDIDHDGSLNDTITYAFEPGTPERSGYISRTITNGETGFETGPTRMTAPEVNITDMRFYVSGSTPNDSEQPKVQIYIAGSSLAGPRIGVTEFKVQTLVSQRIPDFE